MSLNPQEKKKVAFLLAVLLLVGGYSVYDNFLSGPSVPASSGTATRPKSSAPAPLMPVPGGTSSTKSGARARARSEGFHPVMRSKRTEDRIDPTTVDPTLRLDLLAKVQAVDLTGGARNLFQFGQPPVMAKVEVPAGPETKVIPFRNYGPPTPPPPPAPLPPQPEPPPPPIPLKYYAFWVSKDNGKRTACFMDGEDILMAGEGETLKRRYRVIRINATNVVMEDLEVKKQQTLQLTPEETQGL